MRFPQDAGVAVEPVGRKVVAAHQMTDAVRARVKIARRRRRRGDELSPVPAACPSTTWLSWSVVIGG
jgi:hypothetical protein